jgi:LemA protein
MNTGLIVGIVAIVGVIALVALWITIYNGLVAKKNTVENAFAGIDATLKKRFDLIPNLVATVKQYAQHEAETLIKVTQARAHAMSGPISPSARVDLENQLTKALGGLMVAIESYPDLKANENFIRLQGSLNEVEEQLSASRRFYNSAVTDFNNAIQMFPSSIVAGRMRLTRHELFSIPEAERQSPNVRSLFAQ